MQVRVSRVPELTPEIASLANRHFDLMRSSSPVESCHVMRPEDLFSAGAQVFEARADDGRVLGMGALKPLDDRHGEVKSMHTLSEARGLGVGALIVQHLLEEAATLGLSRVSLETGSAEQFAPARRLYERYGFTYCSPFADYTEDPLSCFMTRDL